MPENKRDATFNALSSTSLRIIAAAIVLTALYYASLVVITLICSVLIAFVLDPGVELLERIRLPRWVGALVMVLLSLALLYVSVYLLYDRAVSFVDDLPKYVARLKQIMAPLLTSARTIGHSTSTILPTTPDASLPVVRLAQESPWTQFLYRGIGSVYAFAVTVMFTPFLVFFMLNSKQHIWQTTLHLFPRDRRQQAEDAIRGISVMVREFVLGNFYVTLISAALITPVLAAIDLPYDILMGPLAALLTMIPYIGVALGVIPPLLVALVNDNYKTVGPFVIISVTVVLVHLVAINLLTPKLVGHRLRLNALTVTIGMMFWGWLWGGLGLILAIPITAAFKAVCDNVERLKPIGAWMEEG